MNRRPTRSLFPNPPPTSLGLLLLLPFGVQGIRFLEILTVTAVA